MQMRKKVDKGYRSGHAHNINTVCRAHPLMLKPTHTHHILQSCMHDAGSYVPWVSWWKVE